MNSQLPTTEVSGPPNLYPGFAHFALRALVPGTIFPCDLRLEVIQSDQQDLRLMVALPRHSEVSSSWLQRLLNSGVTHAFTP